MSGSILHRGSAEIERREEEEQARIEYRQAENHVRTVRKFQMDFYREHYVYDRESRRYVEDSENPFPLVTDWEQIGAPSDSWPDSTFVCEGIRYLCRWEFHGTGGDRAYWDDGWWPNWYVVLTGKRRWLRFLKREFRREVPVYGPANVAELLGAGS